MPKRSLRQQWSWERKFEIFGSLAGIRTRLNQIANYDSILYAEGVLLLEAVNSIELVIKKLKKPETEEQSFNEFQARRLKEEKKAREIIKKMRR